MGLLQSLWDNKDKIIDWGRRAWQVGQQLWDVYKAGRVVYDQVKGNQVMTGVSSSNAHPLTGK